MKTTRYEAAGRLAFRKAAAWLLACIIATAIGGAAEGKAEEKNRENGIHLAKQGEVIGEKSLILKSENMTPEKSPEEFWERFMEESKREDFGISSFIKKVTRGLRIEWKINNRGETMFTSQSNNPNYHIAEKAEASLYFQIDAESLVFNYEKFCLTPDLLKKYCEERKKCRFDGMEDINRKYGNIIVYYRLESVAYIYFYYDRNDAKCIRSMKFNYFYIQ